MISSRARISCLSGILWASCAHAQLIPPGQPLPRTANPPVVFLNGYESDCGGSSFSSTFGIADQVMQASGRISVFFDNCTLPNKPSIEKLGTAFGAFLAGLKYTDGTAVDTVDLVAHSMGGLIARSYLSGKQDQEGSFSPPPATRVRKAIFMATPHFGSGEFNFGFSVDTQVDELTSGSHFLFGLATWNDGTDDLRGIDAIAMIGNGGTGLATMPGFDDGLVALTSASLGFYQPGRTRVLPYCHIDGGGLISFAGLCGPTAKGIANIRSAGDDTARIIVSFLNNTTEWQTLGQAAEQNSFLSTLGGLSVRTRTADDLAQVLNSATATAEGGATKKLNMSNNEIAYTDAFPAGKVMLVANSDSALTTTISLPAGTGLPVTLKPGPNISRVQSAAAALFPLSFAPRMIVSVYGASLARSTDQARSLPLPETLSDAQAMLNGSRLGLFYVSATQINAVLPDTASGFVKLTVQNSSGSASVNLLVEAAHASIFTLDSTGTGPAAAINVRNGLVVSNSNPLHANDFMELFLTGLGSTTQATVTIGGVDCPTSYAGPAPNFVGLDQINCRVPSGLPANPAAPLLVSSAGRTSNTTTVAIE